MLHAHSRIPHASLDRMVFGLFEKYRLGPVPSADDAEEFHDNDRASCLRIELADSSHEHSPCHTARESDDIAVDGTPCKPVSGFTKLHDKHVTYSEPKA